MSMKISSRGKYIRKMETDTYQCSGKTGKDWDGEEKPYSPWEPHSIRAKEQVQECTGKICRIHGIANARNTGVRRPNGKFFYGLRRMHARFKTNLH